jgi:RHS repeat-associated protein
MQAGHLQPWIDERPEFRVSYFRGRVANTRVRVEQWVEKATQRVHWRTRDVTGILTVYGLDPSGKSRISDPLDGNRTFLWLPEVQYHPNGNAIQYDYAAEDTSGVDSASAFERSRFAGLCAQRYLKRIRYGNTRPIADGEPPTNDNRWLFEVVFDYGDHGDAEQPGPAPDRTWPVRPDPFATGQPGFEVRTWRLCRRVLVFHSFDSLGPKPALVAQYLLEHDEQPSAATLSRLRYSAYRYDDEGKISSRRSLPPLVFTYSKSSVAGALQPAPLETIENVPHGLTGPNYQWIDLLGEGLPGILTETGTAWYFKPNEGGGNFGRQQLVAEQPACRLGECVLADFDADGSLNLAVFQGRQAGFFEFDRDLSSWSAFRPFLSLPHLEAAGARAQWLDVDGDGRPDLILANPERLTWFPCLGKDGFGDPLRAEHGPASSMAPPGEDPSLAFFFADMNGDGGLLDQVRVSNGRVEYWPQLGQGRFGEPILMEDSPLFAPDDEFDPRRIVFVDLDGTGTADLLYVGRDELRYWYNASGNRLVEGGHIELPSFDKNCSWRVLDFLGNGTPCLVWSSPLPGNTSPIQYLPLTSTLRPRLLQSINNSMGAEVLFEYSSSASHYLRDRRAGRPWASRLPTHPIVVDRKQVSDTIGGSQSVSRYEYHDGCFDGTARSFRGFGLVDQYDAEWHEGPDAAIDATHTTPACLRTWFHTGTPQPRSLPDIYRGDDKQPLLPGSAFENPGELEVDDYEYGLRTLSGLVIREELFALSEQGRRIDHPFRVTQTSYTVQRVQARHEGNEACFSFFASERLVHDYEQQPSDPRVVHQMVFELDAAGNVARDCNAAYARRATVAAACEAQTRPVVTAHRRRFANLDTPGCYELGIPVETEEFEVVGIAGSGTWAQMRADLEAALAAPLDHHQSFAGDGPQARRLAWDRTFYWNDARDGPLPLASIGASTLPHHREVACFTTAFVDEVLGTRVDAAGLRNEGGYQFADGYWWQINDTYHFGSTAEFLPLVRVERLDNGASEFGWDPWSLAVKEIKDPAGNRTSADIDYHVIAPHRIVDTNDNVSEVLYDPLGVISVSSSYGEVLDDSGAQRVRGQEPLSAYSAHSDPTWAAILADPASYVQRAAQFVHYELDAWVQSATPPRVLTLVREELAHDGTGQAPGPSRIQVVAQHLDGFRRVLQSKTLVEAGPALQRDSNGQLLLDGSGQPVEGAAVDRWLALGHIVYNRKQEAVRQYEPYYSTSPAYDPEDALARFGLAHEFWYDAVGRLIGEDLPNGAHSRTMFEAWAVYRFDANDTVLTSRYRTSRSNLPSTDPQRRALAKAELHADTPIIEDLNPQGQVLRRVETAPDGSNRITEMELDTRGQVTSVIDPRGLRTFRYLLDMRGRVFGSESMDAGDKKTLFDIYDRPIRQWDARGVHVRRRFDALDRPTSVFVDGALGLSHLTEQMVYGDDASVTDAKLRNARGRLALHRDQAGTLTFEQYDAEGRLLRTERRLRTDYKGEPDWTDRSEIALEPERYLIETTFDALGRVRQQRLPDGTSRRLEYLRGGGLDQITVSTSDGVLTDFVLLSGSSFNARRQRARALIGSNIEVTTTFEADTFRTRGITARRLPPVSGGTAMILQDLEYAYDPVGNVTYRVDHSQQPAAPGAALQGLNVSAESEYTYDAFYQLTRATGRVHQALLQHDYRPSSDGSGRFKGTRHLNLNNGAAVERFARTYQYDLAGNVRSLSHQGLSHTWTTDIWTSPASNRSVPALEPDGSPVSNREQRFDANGNGLYLPHLQRIEWSYRNALVRAVIVDRSATGGPDDCECYVYDGEGRRIRKVAERLVAGQLEVTEKIYFEGCEIKRLRSGGQLLLERCTSHVSDGVNRIAVIHRWTADSLARETADVTRPRIRFQLTDNLGSSQIELDEQGTLLSYEEYFPYGGTAFLAGDQLHELDIKDYRFSGKERDEATGLYYFGYRYYAAWIGKWMTPDPIGPDDDVNLYRYVFNNPLSFVDPDGLQAQGESASASSVPMRYIPFESVPAALQPDRSQPYRVVFTAENSGSFTVYTSMAELESAASQHEGAWIGVYEPGPMLESVASFSTRLDEAAAALRPPGEDSYGGGDLTPRHGDGKADGTSSGDETENGSGPALGPDGNPAESSGTSKDPAGVHSADGASSQNTRPDPQARGAGKGRAGSGPGGGGTDVVGDGAGRGGQGPGQGLGLRGEGTGATDSFGNDPSAQLPQPPPPAVTSRDGAQDGSTSGDPNGAPWGRSDGDGLGRGRGPADNSGVSYDSAGSGRDVSRTEAFIGGFASGALLGFAFGWVMGAFAVFFPVAAAYVGLALLAIALFGLASNFEKVLDTIGRILTGAGSGSDLYEAGSFFGGFLGGALGFSSGGTAARSWRAGSSLSSISNTLAPSSAGRSELGNALSGLGRDPLGRNLNTLDEFSPGAGFSGVLDVESGKFLAYPSGSTRLASGGTPLNLVDQFGGHGEVNRVLSEVLGSTSTNRLGFSMTLDDAGSFAVRYNSRTINVANPNFAGRTVPESMRQQILDAISWATGRRAYSAQ